MVISLLSKASRSKQFESAKEMVALARQPLELRQARQLIELNALLMDAKTAVPLYRKRLAKLVDERGLDTLDALTSLPITRKADLMAGFPDLVTREGDDRESWQYVSTSGTVGRVVTVKDFGRRDSERAAALHAFRNGWGYALGYPILQIPPNICNIVCGEDATNENESFRKKFWEFTKAKLSGRFADVSDLRGTFERRVVYRTRILDPLAPKGSEVPEEHLETIWERIRKERPFLLHALPEYLLLLADWASRTGRPQIVGNLIIPMGGLASPAMRRRILKGLGGTFLDLYGTSELGTIGFESEPGEGVRIIEELFIVEILRPDGSSASEGEIGRVVITDLVNRAMPFIRYEVGDAGFLTAAPAGSEDSARRLHLVGRMDEVIRGANGTLIDPRRVRDILIEGGNCMLFRLIEKQGGKIVLDYVPQHGAEISEDKIVDDLRELLGHERQYRIRAVRSIPTENSGKFRLIKCEQTNN